MTAVTLPPPKYPRSAIAEDLGYARDTAVRLEAEVHHLHDLIRTYLTGGTYLEANAALEALGGAAGLHRARPGHGGANTGRWVPRP